MSSPALNRLLRNLNADPGLLAELENDPDGVLAHAEVTDVEAAMLRSPERYRLLQSVQGGAQANPSF